MQRIAFKMKLLQGCEAEYKKRHDEIWPELSQLLYNTGISDYAIFLDPETLDLLGVLAFGCWYMCSNACIRSICKWERK
jgi:L-rhamnose mutarotase